MRRLLWLALLSAVVLWPSVTGAQWTPVPVVNDPNVRMPGTQPANGVSLESPDQCMNCHADYKVTIEPAHNWKGSIMAQAARDFIIWACLTVAAQDSIWAVGNPNATDICLRCHFPSGWLEGRSDPTNATRMAGADFDGIHCDFCHSKYDPFFAQLRPRGDTVWRLWKYNYQRGVAGAAPYPMTQTIYAGPVPVNLTRFQPE